MKASTLPSVLVALGAKADSPESDAALLGRYLADRDDAAFASLVQRYARLVWRVARTRCRSDATAEDVFQATFVALARKAGSIRQGAALAGWLHRTAHRLAVRATRSERPAVQLPTDKAVSADPLDALTARELLTAVDDELTKLADAERSVVLLCGLDNLSLDQAATRLGCSPGAVKGRLERGRAKLRARLAARGLTLPAVALALVGGPPAAAIQAATRVTGGAVPPAVEHLLAEGLNVKGTITKAAVAVALVGVVLALGGGAGGPTPAITAAPVPKALKKDHTAWGEELGGLRAGLRMPSGTTMRQGESAELQVLVRNVSREAIPVTYSEQSSNCYARFENSDGVVTGVAFLVDTSNLRGFWVPVEPRVVTLEPGEEVVRWTVRVRHSPEDDKTPPGPHVDLPAGEYQFVMPRICGDVRSEKMTGKLPAFHRLGTGTLAVRLSDRDEERPISTRAPVPKDAGKRVVWSEPVRADWKGSGVGRVSGLWLPNGKSVLVPSPTVSEKGEPLGPGGVDFRDADTGKVTKTLPFAGVKQGQSFQPSSLALSADGKGVYAAGAVFGGGGESPRGIVTWRDADKDDKPVVTTDTAPTDAPIAPSVDGKQLATLGAGGTIEVRDLMTGKLLWVSNLGGGKRGQLTSLAHHPTDGSLLAGTTTGEWISLDGRTGRMLLSASELGVSVRAVAFSADGKQTAFGGESIGKGPALVLAGKELPSDAVPEKVAVHGLAFSHDGKHLAAACSDGAVRVFEAEGGKRVVEAKEHKEAVFGVAYSPDGAKLLTVGKDAVKVWDVDALMKGK